MKRILSLVLCVLLTVSLCACSRSEESEGTVAVVESIPETTAPAATEKKVDKAVNAYRAVLRGEEKFIDSYCGAPTPVNADDFSITDNFGTSTTPAKFELLDLDRDQTLELILWMTADGDPNAGFWVLRYWSDWVYGYQLTYRSFDQLKADGTFRVSGGAYDYGIGTMRFSDNNWFVDRVVSCETATLDDGSTEEQYYVNGESVAKDEFEAVYSQQGEKPDAPWYDFSVENLALVGINLAE